MHYAKVNNCENCTIMQNARYNIKQRQKSFKVPNNAKARLYHVPQYANCIIMQYMKLSEVQNNARCQIMQCKKLFKMQSQSRCKECKFQILVKDQSDERCKIMKNTKQSNAHICKMQNLHAFLNGVTRTRKMVLHALIKWCCTHF